MCLAARRVSWLRKVLRYVKVTVFMNGMCTMIGMSIRLFALLPHFLPLTSWRFLRVLMNPMLQSFCHSVLQCVMNMLEYMITLRHPPPLTQRLKERLCLGRRWPSLHRLPPSSTRSAMSQAAAAKAKAKAKIEEPSKSSGKGDKMDKKKTKSLATWEEKYDESRTVAADPRDPRTLGAPCWGNHTPAAAYRGSVSGSNGHATWVGCERCQLRLSYTPAFGATGLHRQAGPIPEDTRRQVEELKEKAPYNPLLRTQAVGLDGAERSLMSKLDNIRARKAAAGYAPRSPDSNETTAPSSNQTPVPRTPSSVVEIPDDEEEYVPSPAPTDKELLSMVPGSKSRRNERPAEEVEYADREDRSWSTVTSPEKRTGASS